jgi:hypothetical protein
MPGMDLVDTQCHQSNPCSKILSDSLCIGDPTYEFAELSSS